jgi:hypothetical protein
MRQTAFLKYILTYAILQLTAAAHSSWVESDFSDMQEFDQAWV